MFDEMINVGRAPENKIIATSFDEYEIVFLVSERTEAQKNIPLVIDGREVKVLLSL